MYHTHSWSRRSCDGWGESLKNLWMTCLCGLFLSTLLPHKATYLLSFKPMHVFDWQSQRWDNVQDGVHHSACVCYNTKFIMDVLFHFLVNDAFKITLYRVFLYLRIMFKMLTAIISFFMSIGKQRNRWLKKGISLGEEQMLHEENRRMHYAYKIIRVLMRACGLIYRAVFRWHG